MTPRRINLLWSASRHQRAALSSRRITGGTSGAALCISLCVHISTTTFPFHLLSSFHNSLVPLHIFNVSVFF